MPLIVGIDEAGYGPVLGPFVCAATLWRVAPTCVDADAWALMDDAVVRPGGGRREGRLPVGDSKKVFNRDDGLHTLERSVLAFAAATGLQAGTVAQLLASVGFDTHASAGACPWYRDLTRPLPTDPARCAFEGAAARLRQTMERAQYKLVGVRAIIVTEDRFNARVHVTRNKSAVVLESVLTHIDHAGRLAEREPLVIRADRLGGRTNYRDVLMAAFPHRPLTVLSSADHESAYRLDGGLAPWEIAFLVQAEQRHLPVALASMFAKYIRELLMDAFNVYWARALPGVRPTAGYYTDAQRFLGEIQPVIAAGQVPPTELFVRER